MLFFFNRHRRFIFLFAVMLIESSALASTPFDQKPLAEGYVSSVNTIMRIITIHGGQMVIDATEAEIRGPAPDQPRSFSAIRPGSHIAVVFREGVYAPGQPLPATIIQVLERPEGTITGKIESIDLTNKTFTVLGQPIGTTDTTRYGSIIPSLDKQTLAELPIGNDVTVFLDGNLDKLVAHRVFIIAPFSDSRVLFNGIVRSIKGDTWTFMRSPYETVKVTSMTTIEDQPRVGDLVQVLARIDDDELTAELIERAPVTCPGFTPNPTFGLQGIVIERTADFIRFDIGNSIVRATFDDETLFDGGDTNPGDNVDVRVEKIGSDYKAKFVMKLNHRMNLAFFGKVTAITGNEWLIVSEVQGSPDDSIQLVTRRVTVDGESRVHNNPQVGDSVIVVVDREPNGDMKAKVIDKDRR